MHRIDKEYASMYSKKTENSLKKQYKDLSKALGK